MEPIVAAEMTMWKDRLVELGVIVGLLWSLLKYVFEPRLLRVIEQKADQRVTVALANIKLLEARMEQVERDHIATDNALHLVGEGLARVTKVMEGLSTQLGRHGESLAYIEGTMRARAPRQPFIHGDNHEGP